MSTEKRYEINELTDTESTADASNTLECHYIKFEVGGKTIVEIDKFGYKAVINGVDIMEAVRRNIGMS